MNLRSGRDVEELGGSSGKEVMKTQCSCMEFSTNKNKFIQTEIRKAVTKDQGTSSVHGRHTLAILRGLSSEEIITEQLTHARSLPRE